METAIISALSALLGTAVGGVISFYLQKQRFEHEFRIKIQEDKTVNMAEKTAWYYLHEEDFLERSFEHLETKLGGFEGDELRRILVRAGAVRFIREKTGNEYWCLVENLPEKYKRDKERNDKNKS